ncbi:hypothetical protein PtA15_10A388 [Puccinia triticina]|uniref:Uncharacterized protein n=1 Tax=Puccinia triticina TaxID=208348 RepID=A0ABY7CWD2_9BASI|nr:uncharacterized protein PtA15_10A388 [Puccinia triticina]WAQ88965.1 hypothetical protein PtA15_10A388 [Puccinia triticina]
MLTIRRLGNSSWFNVAGVFAVTHTSVDEPDWDKKTVALMTQGKYYVAGGLKGIEDHACVRLTYRGERLNKLGYGKFYVLKGFLVGAKRHEMPFFMVDVNDKKEVPKPNPEGMVSVMVKHNGINENDPDNESMVVKYVVPQHLISGQAVDVFAVGRQILFRGTLAGWNRELDMVRVKVSGGALDVEALSD